MNESGEAAKLEKILNNKCSFDDAYFLNIQDCSENLLENYKLPDKNSKLARSIKRTNVNTNEITIYKSITEAYIKTGITYKKIHNIISNGIIVNESKWEYF